MQGYTVLGWIVWQVATRVLKRKVSQAVEENQAKLVAVGVVGLVLVAGAVAAKASGDDE